MLLPNVPQEHRDYWNSLSEREKDLSCTPGEIRYLLETSDEELRADTRKVIGYNVLLYVLALLVFILFR